jgi:hypothetical protein
MRIRNEKKNLKTMVHKTQFFYLFVSRRTEEVYTQTIDTHVYAYTHIQSSQLDFHRCLFKQCE